MQVLLLEPDFWRYVGIAQILQSEPAVALIGEVDYGRILALRNTPAEPRPDVILVSNALTMDCEIPVVAHLHSLFPGAQILVEGDDQGLQSIANVLRAGAKGYFLLSSDPPKLLKALSIVNRGFIWAPREALALLIAQGSGRSSQLLSSPATGGGITPKDAAILKLLQRGLSNKDIAQRLGIAEVTVKTHLTKLYRRFNVHTRLELLAFVIDHRLLNATESEPSRPSRRHTI